MRPVRHIPLLSSSFFSSFFLPGAAAFLLNTYPLNDLFFQALHKKRVDIHKNINAALTRNI